MAEINTQVANTLEVHLIKTLPKLNRKSTVAKGNLSLSTGQTTRNRMTVVQGDIYPRSDEKTHLSDHLGVTLRYDSKLLLSGGCALLILQKIPNPEALRNLEDLSMLKPKK